MRTPIQTGEVHASHAVAQLKLCTKDQLSQPSALVSNAYYLQSGSLLFGHQGPRLKQYARFQEKHDMTANHSLQFTVDYKCD